MTKEEALAILKYNSKVIHQTINGETDPNEVEALDMAIKALEQSSDDVKAIHTQGLAEGIRCAMCTNSMKNERCRE